MKNFKRKEESILEKRLQEPRKRLQVVMGPRQCGKTTMVRSILSRIEDRSLYYVADNIGTTDNAWIEQVWETARTRHRLSGRDATVLVIDEIQKIKNWSEAVKKCWDEDTWNKDNIKVVILGSSRVLIQKGLDESLAGRFETIKMGYWSFREMNEAFGMSLDEYIYFGGLPGLADTIADEDRWREQLEDSIVSPMLSRDIQEIEEIRNPALLRNVFTVGCIYTSRELSINSMQNRINSGTNPTIANYLDILDKTMLLKPINKASNSSLTTRNSIPKMQVYCNAFHNLYNDISFEDARLDPAEWGRQFESCIGSYLANQSVIDRFTLLYWRENKGKTREVDFVLKKNDSYVAIEVKSGNTTTDSGLKEFKARFDNKVKASFIVGKNGIPADEFFDMDINKLFTRQTTPHS